MIVASEYNYPIPGSQASFGGEWGLGVKRLISFPDQMTVIKVIIVGFLMFIVYKNKDQIADSIKNSMDPDSCIDEYFPVYIAGPLKIAVIPLKKAAQFLFGCTKKYIYNNKIYMVGTGGSCAIGYVTGFPMIGGAVGGASFVAGLVQSLRQELAELRRENKTMHEATQQQMEKGFTNVDQKAEEHKKEVLNKIDQEVGKLSDQIGGITDQIKKLSSDVSDNIENVGEKVEKLSGELQKATEQMVRLHSNRDIKDAKLFKKLEETSDELAMAQKSLADLVASSMAEAFEKTKKEFEEINKGILLIDGKQNDQAVVLTKVQQNIGLLLDNRDADEKKFTKLLDAIQSSSLSLENVKTKTCNQESVLVSIQSALDKMHKDRESLSGSVNQSIVQCADMADRISKLENKVDTNQVVVIELLKKNNEALLLRMELLERRSIEKETILLTKISDMEEERKKANALLRQDLDKTAKKLYKGQYQILGAVEKKNKNRKPNNNREAIMYQQVNDFPQMRAGQELKEQLQLANNS